MRSLFLISVIFCWSNIVLADTFVWTSKLRGFIIGIGNDQNHAWRNVSASGISGWREDELKDFTLIETCRAPGWYAVFQIHDANINRSINRGICGVATREQARLSALRSCQAESECFSLLNNPQSWIYESFGFDSGSWSKVNTGHFYFLKAPGENYGNYLCAGNDPNVRGRDANPNCNLTSVRGSGLPEVKTRRQMALGQ